MGMENVDVERWKNMVIAVIKRAVQIALRFTEYIELPNKILAL